MSDDTGRGATGGGHSDLSEGRGGEALDPSWWQADGGGYDATDVGGTTEPAARDNRAGGDGGGAVAGRGATIDEPLASGGTAGAGHAAVVAAAGAAAGTAGGAAAATASGTARSAADATVAGVSRAMTGGAGDDPLGAAYAPAASSELPKLAWPAARPPQRRRWPFALGIGSAVAIAVAIIAGVNSGSKQTSTSPTTLPTVPSATGAATVTEAPTTTTAPSTSAAPATTIATTAAPSTTVAPAATTVAPPTTASPTTTAASAPTTATTQPPAPPTPAVRSADSPPDPAAVAILNPTRWAVLSGGKVYLRGRVPSQAVADDLHAKVAAGAGADNVFVEYTIDPSAPLPPSSPIFVADEVLFNPDSAVVRREFQNTLDLGRATMQVNPNVTVTVIGRADARGSAEYNVELSQRRAQAVVDYVARDDIDRARFTIVAKGFDDPVADQSTDSGLTANRAVEFVVAGFLD